MDLLKKKKWFFVFMAIVILGVWYWYSKLKSTSLAVQYKTVIAEKGSITTSIAGSGNIVVDQLATVDPTITGTV